MFASYRGFDQPKVEKTKQLIAGYPSSGLRPSNCSGVWEVSLLLHHFDRAGVSVIYDLHAVRSGGEAWDNLFRH